MSTSMQQSTDNDLVSVGADQSHEHEVTPTAPHQGFNLNNKIIDVLNQLPDLPTELPTPHRHFKHCMAPENPDYGRFSVFLAGSIEMGLAVQWQERLVTELCRYPITVTNPRRTNFTTDEETIREQIKWELSALRQADVICFFFDEATRSPVTLWELGKYMNSEKIVVCCGKGYWRHTNVKVSCKDDKVPFMETFSSLPAAIEAMLKQKGMELDTNGDLVGNNVHVAKPKPKSRLEMERKIVALEREVEVLQAKMMEVDVGPKTML
ncbi:hypothetical protein PMIN01_08071 [Paraphaeosphaeria minitans]|uniref:Uncharacterized protein n=1 Tax=Paraphaeosphaeria minitans TaxID=565426 RepID=A0A9P6GEB6_9PLEO|nr:hypothetical protein PMIN01_08071 [Paraphaeosphaeria minitans]